MKTLETDQLVRFLFDKVGVRGELVRLDASFKALLKHHDYPPQVAIQLGEAISAVTLLAATVKLDGALIMQVEGDGPLSMLVAQATSDSTVRGLAHYTDDLANESGFGELVGRGRMVMTIDAEGSERYQGIVELHGDSLADSIKEYFTRSEQLPTRLWLASDGQSTAGLLLQAMPSGHCSEIDWEHLIMLAETLSNDELLELQFETILHRLFHEEIIRLFDAEPVAFRCSCSRAKIESALLGLGRDELNSLLDEQGVVKANCDFCRASYEFDAVDVAALFSDAMPAIKNQ